jgi:DNA-binding MarR family transcriptional regulator
MGYPKCVPKTSDQDSAAEFSAAWESFVHAIRRAQARGPQPPDELTLAQYDLLRPLADGGALPLCQLADAAGISPPTATRVIDGLERAGAVARTRSEADRREVRVSLTDEGGRLLADKRRRIARSRERLYAGLDPDERDPAERILRHLAQLLGEL